MKRWYVILFLILALLVGDIWGLVVVFALPAHEPAVSPITSSVLDDVGTPVASPFPSLQPTPSSTPTYTSTPTPSSTATPMETHTPTRSPTVAPPPTLTRAPVLAPALTTSLVPPSQPLPALYVDGPYVKRSDNHQPVWLKGVNVEEFRQGTQHTLSDLYFVQGLGIVTAQRWGINLLRVEVDPELIQATLPEIDKSILFAQQNGMYVILVPSPSAIDPARSEERMPVPDNLVVTTMGNLAVRYRSSTNVLYEIWNEPHPDSIASAGYEGQWQIWMQAGIKVAQAIRSQNPRAVLVVPGGTKWARDLTYYRDHPFPFDNVIYDIHDYSAGPDYGYTRDMWTWAIGKYPILIGEFGGNPIIPLDPASIPYMQQTIQVVNQNPFLVHYAMYVLSDDGAWGIFTRGLQRMPRGNLLLNDLRTGPPTRLR